MSIWHSDHSRSPHLHRIAVKTAQESLLLIQGDRQEKGGRRGESVLLGNAHMLVQLYTRTFWWASPVHAIEKRVCTFCTIIIMRLNAFILMPAPAQMHIYFDYCCTSLFHTWQQEETFFSSSNLTGFSSQKSEWEKNVRKVNSMFWVVQKPFSFTDASLLRPTSCSPAGEHDINTCLYTLTGFLHIFQNQICRPYLKNPRKNSQMFI